VIVVTGPPTHKEALVEQAYRDHPDEAAEGVLFVDESVLPADEEMRTATLLAIQRDATRGRQLREQARRDSPLAQMRREAWRRAGL
jgi:hypothetical protein